MKCSMYIYYIPALNNKINVNLTTRNNRSDHPSNMCHPKFSIYYFSYIHAARSLKHRSILKIYVNYYSILHQMIGYLQKKL